MSVAGIPATATPDRAWAYLEAAAVLAYFDLGAIQPVGVERGDDPFEPALLTQQSELTRDPAGKPVWTLTAPIRREALERLIQAGRLLDAMAANPHPERDQYPLQVTLRAYLTGSAKPLDSQSAEELRATLLVRDWLGTSLEPAVVIPPLSEIGPRLNFQNYLAEFRSLAGDDFVGREEELKLLETHVGLSQSTGPARFRPAPVAPLMIWAAGGMGKSAVLAKFILRYATLDPARRFPIVYLDFDRSVLDPDEPVTFLFDAIDQIAVQFPEIRTAAEAQRAEWSTRMANPNNREDRAVGGETGRRSRFRLKDREWFLNSFIRFANSLPCRGRPLLFVLDTFEEAQFRSKALVEDTLDLLTRLRKGLPTFRAVLSGRREVVVAGYDCVNRELKQLDPEAAAQYLQKCGKVDANSAGLVARQLKRSPLILRIAVQLLRAGEELGPTGFKNVDTSWKAKLLGKSIESQLYSRFLDHIHDEEVQKLAHPGLVLRRLTPDLILEVLKTPCKLKIGTRPEAVNLFERLRKEGALVMDAGPEVVEHRPDLRWLMLEDMMNDPTQDMAPVHRGAIGFYKSRSGADMLAEELYHQLMLEPFERDVVERRWNDEAGRSLGRSVEELPNAAQAYVAARLGFEVDPEVWIDALQPDWEKHASRIAREHLANGRYIFALDALRERTTRLPASELSPIEADVLTLQGRAPDAYKLIEKTLDEALRQRPADLVMAALWRRQEGLKFLSQSGTSLPVSPAQVGKITEALVDSFNFEELAGLLRTRFSVDLTSYSVPGEVYRQIVLALVLGFTVRGRVTDLVAAARRANPTNPKLSAVGTAIGSGTTAAESELQTAAKDSAKFTEVATLRRTSGELEARVARIEITDAFFSSSSTGFLVGPDLLLTSFHQFELPIRNYLRQASEERSTPPVIVRFDLEVASGRVVHEGVKFRLHSEWLVYFSPAPNSIAPGRSRFLDFVLLRLDGNAGFDRRAGGLLRGWNELPGREKPVVVGDNVTLYSYPAGEGLHLSTAPKGVVEVQPGGELMWDTAPTQAGASGAPCYDFDLQLIAMRTQKGTDRNEAVTTAAIARELQEGGVSLDPAPAPDAATPDLGGPLALLLGQLFAGRDFERFLKRSLDRRLWDYVPLSATGNTIFQSLVSAAKRQGWLPELLTVLREQFPSDPHLYEAAQRAGISIIRAADILGVQSLMSVPETDLSRWNSMLLDIERQTCRIVTGQRNMPAIGLLIGPDLVLTDYRAVEPLLSGLVAPDRVSVQFDLYLTNSRQTAAYHLADDWAADLRPGLAEPIGSVAPATFLDLANAAPYLGSPPDFPPWTPAALSPWDDFPVQTAGSPPGSPVLASDRGSPIIPFDESTRARGYAILRLKGSPGDERGWIRPGDIDGCAPGDPALVLQCGFDRPIGLTGDMHGIVALSPDRSRLRFRSRGLEYSTWAACFNAQWELLAVGSSPDAALEIAGVTSPLILSRIDPLEVP